jgi:hypothetical protein
MIPRWKRLLYDPQAGALEEPWWFQICIIRMCSTPVCLQKCLRNGTGDRVTQASTSVTRAAKQDNKVSLFCVFSGWIRQYELGLRAYLHSWYAWLQCHLQYPRWTFPVCLRTWSDTLRYKRQLKALDNLTDVESFVGLVLTLSALSGLHSRSWASSASSLMRWEITVARTFFFHHSVTHDGLTDNSLFLFLILSKCRPASTRRALGLEQSTRIRDLSHWVYSLWTHWRRSCTQVKIGL